MHLTTRHLSMGAVALTGVAVMGAIVAGIVAMPPGHLNEAFIPVDNAAGGGHDDGYVLDIPVASQSEWQAMVDEVIAADPDAHISVTAPAEIEGFEGWKTLLGSTTVPPEVTLPGGMPHTGEVVLTRPFAEELGVVAGDSISLRDGESGPAPFPALAVSSITDSDDATGFVAFEDGWAMAEAYSFSGAIDTYLSWEGDIPPSLEPYVWDEG
ncbi:hypothetical protein [Demequina sp. NBRC 110055]|uniref:hypothetical protein n=1 Tax=Demequina sp. NBRC 110055 TaxID=1570344 RepID=UPI000A00E465|nr:hypothetical protein [Demequina sp. NBRC 110055]